MPDNSGCDRKEKGVLSSRESIRRRLSADFSMDLSEVAHDLKDRVLSADPGATDLERLTEGLRQMQAVIELPKVAYIAMPYRADTEWELVQHIRAAEALALKYWRLGYAVICPHKNTSLLGGAAPDEVWLKGDLAFLARADVVVMGPGWDRSDGATEEYNCARKWGIEVIFDDGRETT